MYFFSVPLAALAGLVFDLGIGIVYITMISDEFIKLFMCLARLRSRKWINNVTRDIA